MIKSTIGKKVVVALTGVVLLGFVVGHLVGNLLVFAGPDAYNSYAFGLKAKPVLLWGVRSLLLLSVVLHILFTIQLTIQNRLSRPVSYRVLESQSSSTASRFMHISGIFLGLYIVYHLLHFTFGSVHPQFDPHDIYSNIILGFQVKAVSLVYILAMIALGFHLHHGVWSMFQTLGLNHEKYNPARRVFASLLSILICVGYISIPMAVMAGVLH